jgi:hypothetical protein
MSSLELSPECSDNLTPKQDLIVSSLSADVWKTVQELLPPEQSKSFLKWVYLFFATQ